MKKRLMICDDEKNILRELSEKIEKIQPGKWEIIEKNSIAEINNYFVNANKLPNVLLMDIKVGHENGIDMAEMIQKKYPWIAIIFISGYSEYAQEIFRVNPIYMLLKPFDDDKLMEALKRAEDYVNKCVSDEISINTKGKCSRVNCKSIYYAESNKRKVNIVTSTEKYATYMKLGDLLEMLPTNFVSSHKSYIVNMNYIREITYKEIVLSNGDKVPVSRAKYKGLKESFLQFVNADSL